MTPFRVTLAALFSSRFGNFRLSVNVIDLCAGSFLRNRYCASQKCHLFMNTQNSMTYTLQDRKLCSHFSVFTSDNKHAFI